MHHEANQPNPKASQVSAQLIIIRGRAAGERIELVDFPTAVGRESFDKVVGVDDDEISRKHFLIKRRGRLFIIQDLESKNGTYLNGERIINSILRNGDKILIGSTEISFVTSDARILFDKEIYEHKMLVDEEVSSFSGAMVPISLELKNPAFSQLRLGSFTIIQDSHASILTTKKIFDFHSNLMVINDMHEAARTLLKYLGHIFPALDRSAFFLWNQSPYLVPYAVTHHRDKKTFFLNKSAFEDVLNRKLGIVLSAKAAPQGGEFLHRAVLPMIHNNHVLGMVHLETSGKEGFPMPLIEQMNTLISRCAANFECMHLRHELDGWLVGSMETLLSTIKAKDTYTHGHSERVSRYSMAIANELKLDRHTKKLLLASGLCHDIGKIGIADNILKKAALLSPDEYEEMKMHPTIGSDIISHLPNAAKFLSGVKYHHEKWDGTGYPDGLVGEEIPFFARIVCIADVFDAMVSGRSYSGFLDQNDAAEKLASEAELFDPEIVKAFVRAQDSGALTLKTSTQNRALPDQETPLAFPKGDDFE